MLDPHTQAVPHIYVRPLHERRLLTSALIDLDRRVTPAALPPRTPPNRIEHMHLADPIMQKGRSMRNDLFQTNRGDWIPFPKGQVGEPCPSARYAHSGLRFQTSGFRPADAVRLADSNRPSATRQRPGLSDRAAIMQSGRQDSNLRLPAPKAGPVFTVNLTHFSQHCSP